ncbi:ribosome maturation factor RimM [Melaminivora alkalimesophila]|uniref:Ribosome maturation factor RimM n=1 Tax=Melaminivora alkalimesophila TaxID=1165852 RepID=A0A317RDJ1_9BURK|nr:ribosome maturation factor RimM [Melaminivora alkalimesophila]PWW47659.1 16S rRNA processing protein RimM [Melaminivora alkalimesophila]
MPEQPVLPAAELPEDAVEVGRIADAWGVKGWFKVQPFSSDAEALLSARAWFLQPALRGGKTAFTGTVQLSIRQARPHSDTLVAWAHGIDDRDAAEGLRGARVFVPRSAFPRTAEDEYYWVDLIGLEVVNRQGVALGTVRELLPTGPQTTLVLDHLQDGKPLERLIPFVSAFVDEVDLAKRRITVDWQPDF